MMFARKATPREATTAATMIAARMNPHFLRRSFEGSFEFVAINKKVFQLQGVAYIPMTANAGHIPGLGMRADDIHNVLMAFKACVFGHAPVARLDPQGVGKVPSRKGKGVPESVICFNDVL